jgi:ABC-type transporter Mla subunit MlaD
MYKWLWLGVAVVSLGAALWMLNDIRLQVRQSSATIQDAGLTLQSLKTTSKTVNEKLPRIVERTNKTSDVVATQLPRVVERIDSTTETLAELSADVRQLKQLAGLTGKARDEGLTAYANSLLDKIAASGGAIGNKKVVGSGLKNKRPAAEWVVGARREALFQLLLAKSKKEMLDRLAKTALGGHWYIELPGKEPMTLTDWAKENHPESKGL